MRSQFERGTRTKRHSEEPIIRALRQAGSGVPATEICRAQRQVLDSQSMLISYALLNRTMEVALHSGHFSTGSGVVPSVHWCLQSPHDQRPGRRDGRC